MEIIRNLTNIANKIRTENNIPLSQALLNFSYGSVENKNIFHLFEDEIKLLAEAINIYDLSYDFNINNYELYNSNKPTDGWLCSNNGKYWVCLDPNIPDWLSSVYKDRKANRIKMKKRKDKGLFK